MNGRQLQPPSNEKTTSESPSERSVRRIFLIVMIATGFGELPSPAIAQTVPLPTTRQFSVSTTVAVPDQGSTSLGRFGSSRTNRSAPSRPLAGPFPSIGRSGINRQANSAQAFAQTTVLNNSEWDDRLRNSSDPSQQPAPPLGHGDRRKSTANSPSPIVRRARFLTKHMGKPLRQ